MATLPDCVERLFERDRIDNIRPIDSKPCVEAGMEEDAMDYLQSLNTSPVPGVAIRDVDVIAVFQNRRGLTYERARELLTPHALLIRGMGYRFSS